MSLISSFRAAGGEDAVASVPSIDRGSADSASDEFRLIKWHFLANASHGAPSGKNARVILITSACAGEGKSYVAHHLAASFARDPHTVLTLIDANFDHPSLGSASWMGGSAGGPGLLDYLDSGNLDSGRVMKATGLNNVRVILTGENRGNAPELLATGRFEQLLHSLTAENSHVILDAGPVLSDGSAAVLGRYAGHIAFVIAANTTSRNDITQALATLDRIAGPIDDKTLGLIFN